MVHVSELSWNHIKNPAEVVKVGDTIEVFVISFDPEKKKISLGYKTDATNPWTIFNEKYAVGDVVDVKIVKLMTFGAFAEIIPGVDGLIHISQIADRRIAKPRMSFPRVRKSRPRSSTSIRSTREFPSPSVRSSLRRTSPRTRQNNHLKQIMKTDWLCQSVFYKWRK